MEFSYEENDLDYDDIYYNEEKIYIFQPFNIYEKPKKEILTIITIELFLKKKINLIIIIIIKKIFKK